MWHQEGHVGTKPDTLEFFDAKGNRVMRRQVQRLQHDQGGLGAGVGRREILGGGHQCLGDYIVCDKTVSETEHGAHAIDNEADAAHAAGIEPV